MGQLIRTFLKNRRERRYWRTRLEPILDLMMEEMERVESLERQKMENDATAQLVPSHMHPRAEEAEIFKPQTAEDMEQDFFSQETQTEEQAGDEETSEELTAQNSDPMVLFPPIALDDLIEQLIQDQREETADHQQGAQEEELLALLDSPLDQLPDHNVDELKPLLHRIVRQNRKGSRKQITYSPAPRRKNIDSSGTIKKMARNGGCFTGFRYLPSPSEKQSPVDLQHFVVIADVSGSMGRYVGIVLYLLACLEGIADVDSYVFSDETTYASRLMGDGTFDEQFVRLKEGAASWEYGTQLAKALHTVRTDHLFAKDSKVVLITDGGFSLVDSDWENTVTHIQFLREHVEELFVVTPNHYLFQEGPECEEKLWNVEREPRKGYEIVGLQQRIARFGLLTRYSHRMMLCQTADDLISVIQALLEEKRH